MGSLRWNAAQHFKNEFFPSQRPPEPYQQLYTNRSIRAAHPIFIQYTAKLTAQFTRHDDLQGMSWFRQAWEFLKPFHFWCFLKKTNFFWCVHRHSVTWFILALGNSICPLYFCFYWHSICAWFTNLAFGAEEDSRLMESPVPVYSFYLCHVFIGEAQIAPLSNKCCREKRGVISSFNKQ